MGLYFHVFYRHLRREAYGRGNFTLHQPQAERDDMLVTDGDLERNAKEAAMTHLKVLYRHSPKRSEENQQLN
jgi:hypothetical protein